MMRAALTALVLGTGVFLAAPQEASAAPLGPQAITTPSERAAEKAHDRRYYYRHRHWDHGHHYRYRKWHHRHGYYRPYRHHHWRRHDHFGPHFGFSIGPSWGYGHHYYRRWH